MSSTAKWSWQRFGNQDTGLPRTQQDADAILFNTCSVREHAEEKAYNNLFHLKQLKLANPGKDYWRHGLHGSEGPKGNLRSRSHLSILVVGPGQLHRIPELIANAQAGEKQQLAVSLSRRDGTVDDIKRSHETFDPLRDPEMRPTPFQAYLRIQIGCDKFCTYCIVPMTRGPEQGRAPDQIIAEAKVLADQGCKEIVLAWANGQLVSLRPRGQDDATLRSSPFAAHNRGIERIKFVTNYPKDMTRELLETVRDFAQVFALSACASPKR